MDRALSAPWKQSFPCRRNQMALWLLGRSRQRGQQQRDILLMAWSAYDGSAISLRQGKAKRLGKVPVAIHVPCTKALKITLDAAPRKAAVILTTKTGLSFKKRYFAEKWEETCKLA